MEQRPDHEDECIDLLLARAWHRATAQEFRSQVKIDFNADDGEIAELERHLKKREVLRWHPDKFNLRTDERGVVDESLGKQPEVIAVMGAIQELVELCELYW